jgi:5-methylcytosine-specific restriction protein A
VNTHFPEVVPVDDGPGVPLLKTCAEPGCEERVDGGRCRKHRSKDERRGRHYSTSAWRRRRAAFLRRHPRCECDLCLLLPADQRPVATDVDHKVEVRDGGTDADENLRAYSHSHHSRKTARTSPGGWNFR